MDSIFCSNINGSKKDVCTVKCEHPNLILHPYAKSNYIKHGIVCVRGMIYNYKNMSSAQRLRTWDTFYRQHISPFFQLYKEHPESSFDFDSLLLDNHIISSDGECLPLFIIVPCGKCRVCSYSKLNDVSARCALETYTSKSHPMFVTLTYDDDNLPSDGSVSLDDIQKFLKLLRINLNRFLATPYVDENGCTRYRDAKINLRYLYCSEYTPKKHRPHYHLLIWNIPYLPNGLSSYQKLFLQRRTEGCPYNYTNNVFGSVDSVRNSNVLRCPLSSDLGRCYGYTSLLRLIWASWKKGFIKCEVSKNAGRYVAKYIGKGSSVPDGLAPTFVHWSNRRGLGYAAYDIFFKALLSNNPSLTSLTFFDPKVGSITTVPIPKYYRNLLSPSLSVLAKSFRKDLTKFHRAYLFLNEVCKHYYLYEFEPLKKFHRDVYQKFSLFAPLCELDLPYHSNKRSEIQKFVSQCKSIWFFDQNNVSKIISKFMERYNYLMSVDLDSIGVNDAMNYKVLSQIARVDYAKSHPLPLSVHTKKATDYYAHARRIEYRTCL
ncbi:replication initiator protein [Sigmofec virus UA08Rod_4411]|uniref:Replication initiator protein n=1 Tax=Sigmofec virus UA08Rod_4411 TaxID=2929401 RepID=A0A976N112_9VIRU|nr:replication initiator protein [Sigmofec virus UA08Rod_4411]